MTRSAPQEIQQKSAQHHRPFPHIRELDGIRGIAAIMVFFHHVCFTSINPTGWSAGIRLLHHLSASGNTGVDLFFVLSGFLITSLLLQARNTGSYYHDFYWKRALRILPLYALCLLGVFLFVPGSGRYILLSALFVSNFAWLFRITTSGPFWTLAIEEQFYLLWPSVVRRRSVEQIRRWAIGIGAAAILLRLIDASFGHYFFYFTFFRCDGLAAGAFLACWFSQRDSSHQNLRRENRTIALAVLAGTTLLAISMLPAENLRMTAFLVAFRLTGVTLLYTGIIAFLISHSGQRSLAFLRSPLLTFFGLISYAMYLSHMYVLMFYDHLRGPMQPGDNTNYITRFVTVLLGTIAFALLSRYLIELPAMSLRKYVLNRPAPVHPEDPPLPLGNM
jgi:peptidoglycan/LPS O-acetylase OafA/YrhL